MAHLGYPRSVIPPTTTVDAQRSSRGTGAAVILCLALFFVATQRWLGWDAALRFVGASDVFSYVPMAEAVPGLPDERIGSAYAGRLPVHYAVGLLDHGTPLTLRSAYAVCVALFIGTTVFTVWATMRRLGLALGWCSVLLAVLVLNPYAFRFYVLAPGMVADVAFVAGLAMAARGVMERRNGVLVVGALLACLSRQTALFALPVLAAWMSVADRAEPWRRPVWVLAASIAVAPLVIQAAISATTAPFSKPYGPRIPDDTVLPLLAQIPGSLAELAMHTVRVAVPFLLPLVLLLVTAIGIRRQGTAVPEHFWGLLAVSAAIVVQPLGMSDSFPGFAYNEPRLSALGLVPFVLGIAVLLRSLDRPLERGRALALVATVAGASLHHLYTAVGPASLGQFIALQLGAGAVAAVLLWASVVPGEVRVDGGPSAASSARRPDR